MIFFEILSRGFFYRGTFWPNAFIKTELYINDHISKNKRINMQNVAKHVFVVTFLPILLDGMEWIYKGLNRIFPWEIFQNLLGLMDFAMLLKFLLVFSEYFLKYLGKTRVIGLKL